MSDLNNIVCCRCNMLSPAGFPGGFSPGASQCLELTNFEFEAVIPPNCILANKNDETQFFWPHPKCYVDS